MICCFRWDYTIAYEAVQIAPSWLATTLNAAYVLMYP